MRLKTGIWIAAGLFVAVMLVCFLGRLRDVGISGDGYTMHERVPDALTAEEKLHALLGTAEEPDDSGPRLNLNTASVEELMTLPGIGETLAKRIVRYRTYNGDFQELSHVRDVTGIGDGLYEKIRPYITVE